MPFSIRRNRWSRSAATKTQQTPVVNRVNHLPAQDPDLASGIGQHAPKMGQNGTDVTKTGRIAIPPAPDANTNPAAYLRSIHAVRQRSSYVLRKAKLNELRHFHVNWDKFEDVATYVTSIIKRDYAPEFAKIPPHGRWQHLGTCDGISRVDLLLGSWGDKVNPQEQTRRLIDLFFVSVLLDAGAGNSWKYQSSDDGKTYNRSEGLGVASYHMFRNGMFSADHARPHQVNGSCLQALQRDDVAHGFQADSNNPLDGLDGRTDVLIRLGSALTANPKLFGSDARPGRILDYLLTHPSTSASSVPIIAIPTLWDALMDGLSTIWPATRTVVQDVSLGDAWHCSTIPAHPSRPWEDIVPFHKLTQWLTYSLMVPMQRLLNVRFAGSELMTGLPEYRNGGLLVDTGFLSLRDEDVQRGLEEYYHQTEAMFEVVPLFAVDDPVIIEWRALTVGILDELLVRVNKLLGLDGEQKLSLAQMLEAGSWKAGREIAQIQRPNTKGPPIMIISDGTVF